MNTYDVGDLVQISATFTVGTTPTDPTTLAARVRKPDGTQATYTYGTAPEVVRTAQGSYRLDLTPDQPGTWWYAFEGTGAAQDVQESAFAVRPRRATAAAGATLCDLGDLANLIQVPLDAGDAAAIAAIAAATAVVRGYVGQTLTFVVDDSVLLTGRGVPELYLPELPVVGVSAVSERGIALDAGTAWDWEPGGRLVRLFSTGVGQAYPSRWLGWYPGWRAVAVTYSHGYATLPADLVLVAARVAARMYLGGLRSALVGPHARESDYAAVYQGETAGDAQGAYGPTSAPILTGHEKAILDNYRPLPLGLASSSYSGGRA